jgi:hypothetical protein
MRLADPDRKGWQRQEAADGGNKSLFKPEISLFCEQAPSWVVMPADTRNLPRYYP